jgi:hypothetical protein
LPRSLSTSSLRYDSIARPLLPRLSWCFDIRESHRKPFLD